MKCAPRRYTVDAADFPLLSIEQIVCVLVEVVKAEGPITAMRQPGGSLALTVCVESAVASPRFATAVYTATTSKAIVEEPLPLAEDMKTPLLRDRSKLEPTEKKIEYVPPEESPWQSLRSWATSCGIDEEDVAAEAARLLGFGRTGRDIKAVIEKVVQTLLNSGTLEHSGEYLFAKRGLST